MHTAGLGGAQQCAHVLWVLEMIEHQHEGSFALGLGGREDLVDGGPTTSFDDEGDPLVPIEARYRGQRATFDLDHRDAQGRRVQDQLVERGSSIGHDQQALGGATGGEGLFDRASTGHDLLVLGERLRG